ncbi:MAG: hypothetical protein AAGF48_11465 [Pseudomonadota bacterium]
MARNTLSALSAFEEKFFGICEGYRQVEEFILQSTLSDMIYSRRDSPAFHSVRAEFGRRVSSFLSVSRLYLNSVPKDAVEITAGTIATDLVKSVISERYDESLSYRVMDAVRNYSQHRALPVTDISVGWRREDEQDRISYRSQFFLRADKLDDKFKSSTRREIEQLGGRVDLKLFLRSYFDDLCSIHERLRKEFQRYKEQSETLVCDWQERWDSQFPGLSLSAVAACCFKCGRLDNEARVAYIDPEVDEYRKWLETSTGHLRGMSNRRVEFD